MKALLIGFIVLFGSLSGFANPLSYFPAQKMNKKLSHISLEKRIELEEEYIQLANIELQKNKDPEIIKHRDESLEDLSSYRMIKDILTSNNVYQNCRSKILDVSQLKNPSIIDLACGELSKNQKDYLRFSSFIKDIKIKKDSQVVYSSKRFDYLSAILINYGEVLEKEKHSKLREEFLSLAMTN